MLKRIAGIFIALLAFAAPAFAQSPFVRVSATVTLAVTNVSATVAIGTSARISTLWVCNTGSNDAYIFFGDSTVVADTTGTILRSGVCGNISPDGKTNIAAITASSTTTLVITPGSGVLFGTGGGSSAGGGGAVTVADGADVTLGAKADAVCGSATGTCTLEALIKFLNNAVTSPIPPKSGAITQSAVSVTNSSTSIYTAALFSNFVKVCVPATASTGIWVNWAGVAAVTAPPSEYMPPGQCDTWVGSTGYMPTGAAAGISNSASTIAITIEGN